MISFWPSFGLIYVAATLLASGGGHLVRFGAFRTVIRDHAVVPAPAASSVAVSTVFAELGAGAAALVLVAAQPVAMQIVLLFAATGALGVGFLLYVRRVLRHPGQAVTCGCSPLSSPLTPASLVPAGALVAVSATALLSTLFVDRFPPAAAAEGLGALTALPLLWGVTLAVLVMLVPASMPSPAVGGRW